MECNRRSFLKSILAAGVYTAIPKEVRAAIESKLEVEEVNTVEASSINNPGVWLWIDSEKFKPEDISANCSYYSRDRDPLQIKEWDLIVRFSDDDSRRTYNIHSRCHKIEVRIDDVPVVKATGRPIYTVLSNEGMYMKLECESFHVLPAAIGECMMSEPWYT